MFNGNSVIAFLGCGRREDFLFGKNITLSKDCEVCQGHLDNEVLQVQWSHVSGEEWPWKINQAVLAGKGKEVEARLGEQHRKIYCFLLLQSKASCPGRTLSGGTNSEASAVAFTVAPHLVSVFPLWVHLYLTYIFIFFFLTMFSELEEDKTGFI